MTFSLTLALLCQSVAEMAHQSFHPDIEAEGQPSFSAVARAIDLGIDYLERVCGPDGRFIYELDIRTGRANTSYDIIRHEGAIYAIGLANQVRPSQGAVATMIRAIRFIRQNYLSAGPIPGQLVIWSQPTTVSAEKQYAELGGAGLGLVAFAEVRKLEPNAVALSELQAMGRFLLSLQKPDGSFIHKYSKNEGPISNWRSLYYPGEAALGLIALYEADHSAEWLLAAAKDLAYLARTRASLPNVPADHWALIATAKLLPYAKQFKSAASEKELIQQAVQICDSILRDQFKGGMRVGLDGAFDSEGRTAPAATRLEGLLSALRFLPNDQVRKRIENASARGIAFLLRAQISTGPHAGGLPGAIAARASNSNSIRIDYVQHAISAWTIYNRVYIPCE